MWNSHHNQLHDYERQSEADFPDEDVSTDKREKLKLSSRSHTTPIPASEASRQPQHKLHPFYETSFLVEEEFINPGLGFSLSDSNGSQENTVPSPSRRSDPDSGPGQTHMVSYIAKNPGSLGRAIQKRLSKTEYKLGALYVFSKGSHPEYLKIGCTTGRIKKRIGDWKRQCGQDLALEHSIEEVPNVVRLEKLIHMELADYRHKEIGCLGYTCGQAHTEWFQVDIDVAERVMNKWYLWVCNKKPYNEDGELRENVKMPKLSYPSVGQPESVSLSSHKRKRTLEESLDKKLPFPVRKRVQVAHAPSSLPPAQEQLSEQYLVAPNPESSSAFRMKDWKISKSHTVMADQVCVDSMTAERQASRQQQGLKGPPRK